MSDSLPFDAEREVATGRAFGESLGEVMISEEIVSAAATRDIDLELVRQRVQARRSTILDAVVDTSSAHDEAKRAVESAERLLEIRKRRGFPLLASGLVLALSLALVAVAVQTAVGLGSDARTWLGILESEIGWVLLASAAIAVFGALLAAATWFSGMSARLESELRISHLRSRERDAFDALREAIGVAVAGDVRAQVADLSRPSAEKQLAVTEAPGLAELHANDFDIETSAHDEVGRLMAAMRGASIGLAGPRGVGKTTLLRTFGSSDEDTIGVVVPAPVRYDAREFFIYLFERLCESVVGPVPDAVVLNDPARGLGGIAAVVATYRRLIRRALGFRDPPLPRGEGRLWTTSLEMLRELRWQRSYTTAVGAEIALSKALKVTGSSDRQVTRLPWSLPQLVHELRGYLARMARESRVVIGVDELDKIASSDDAAAFLNDVKAIFGIPGVFFLISVSEEAMASFERRGQPVRDAFDSAFDQIVVVRPLTYAETSALLRRRVIGMPWPFVAAATALGGGLPREVIRVARQCVLVSRDVGKDFDNVLSGVISLDIASTATATTHAVAAKRTDVGAELVLRWLSSLQDCDSLAALRQALVAAEKLAADLPSSREPSAAVLLRDLVLEVRVRLAFGITLMEILGANDPTRLSTAVANGWIDRMAEVRAGFRLGQAWASDALRRVSADVGQIAE